MRATVYSAEDLAAALSLSRALKADKVVVDVEPWLVNWAEPGSKLSERAITVATALGPEVLSIVLATNSRRYRGFFGESRAAIVKHAHKPWTRLARLGELGTSQVVIGDCYATDGLLALRMRAVFIHVPWVGPAPFWARTLYAVDRVLVKSALIWASAEVGTHGTS